MPTKKPMDIMNTIDYIKLISQYKDVEKHLSKLSQISIEEYANRFKNKAIRRAMSEGIPSKYNEAKGIVLESGLYKEFVKMKR